jgi:aryl-alcohol dehydrogenase-like predicted oxidoreductase
MEKRRLGNTGYQITPIGLGAWAIGGGGWAFGWGPQDDRESIAAIHRAVDLGINWIDTAAAYGLGHSEEIVARALAELPQWRRPLVFTKCSLVWNEKGKVSHSLKPESLRAELEASLRRLCVDAIDLYQIHWPAFGEDSKAPDAPGLEKAWQTLADMKKDGKVRAIGVSNFTAPQMERIRPIATIDTLQPSYSILSRGVEAETLPYCGAHDIGVIVYSPMKSGLLSGAMTRERIAAMPQNDWRRNHRDFTEPKLTENLKIVEKLRAIGERRNCSSGEVAIAWTLNHPAVTAAIVGARRPEQVDGFIGAAKLELTPEEIAECAP